MVPVFGSIEVLIPVSCLLALVSWLFFPGTPPSPPAAAGKAGTMRNLEAHSFDDPNANHPFGRDAITIILTTKKHQQSGGRIDNAQIPFQRVIIKKFYLLLYKSEVNRFLT